MCPCSIPMLTAIQLLGLRALVYLTNLNIDSRDNSLANAFGVSTPTAVGDLYHSTTLFLPLVLTFLALKLRIERCLLPVPPEKAYWSAHTGSAAFIPLGCHQHRRTFVSLVSSFTITRRHSSEARRGGLGSNETVHSRFVGSKVTLLRS
jgi:hypothetical protein